MDLIAFSKKEEYNSSKFNIIGCTIINYLIDKKAHNIGEGNYYRTSQSIQDILYGRTIRKNIRKIKFFIFSLFISYIIGLILLIQAIIFGVVGMVAKNNEV